MCQQVQRRATEFMEMVYQEHCATARNKWREQVEGVWQFSYAGALSLVTFPVKCLGLSEPEALML